MWLLPTRGRPEMMKKLIDSFYAVGGSFPRVAVMIDGDPAEYAGIAWPEGWDIHHSDGEHLEMCEAVRRLVSFYPDAKFYGILADHCRAKSLDWNRIIEEEAGDWHIAYSDDGRLHGRREIEPWRPRVGGMWAVGGELVRAVGWLMLPGLTHLYLDNAWEEIGDRLGILRYRPDVTMTTERPGNGGKVDANHHRMHKGQSFVAADQAILRAWLNDGIDADIARASEVSGIPVREPTITFACVKVGTRFGPEWVNILLDMVRRNVPDSVRIRFACITDDPTGLDPGIDVKFAPEGVEGWWAKLFLFAPGTFPDGERIIYLDLDTLVLDHLDPLLSYRGPLALLRDFYFPGELGSGVMMWRAGEVDLWTPWLKAHRPIPIGGDQAWIQKLRPDAQRLQDLFPQAMVSYKADCQGTIPEGAILVCFHGYPKNDEVSEPWVKEVWKIGGVSLAKAKVALNVSEEEIADNIRANVAKHIPSVRKVPAHEKMAVLVGGGGSLSHNLGLIKALQSQGADVFALNGAALFLRANGITADYQVILDARPANARFLKSRPAKVALIASQCSPEIVDAALAEDAALKLFHVAIQAAEELLKGQADFCWCATTVGLTSLGLAHLMGYRDLHLFGYDSSFREGKLHAYEQDLTAPEARTIEAWAEGKSFVTTPVMLKQAEEFQSVSSALAEADCAITVHGDGLLPHIARILAARRNQPALESAA